MWSCITSIFLETWNLTILPNLELTFTLWEITDPYLVGGMPFSRSSGPSHFKEVSDQFQQVH